MENVKGILSAVAKSLVSKVLFSTFGLVGLVVVLIIVIIAAVFSSSDDIGSGVIGGKGEQLPESVLVWEADIAEAMERHELDSKYLYVMLAILKQESNGDVAKTNGDIFQASESKCGSIGCIKEPLESIDQAVSYFKETVTVSKDNMEVAIQSYNFGNGFATWTQENHDNKWSPEIAIEFSKKMLAEAKNPLIYKCNRQEAKDSGACYGDILYVPSILAFLPNAEGGPIEFNGQLGMPLAPALVTSEYGERYHPIHKEWRLHAGIDFGCIGGVTPIQASQDGTIERADWAGGWGQMVFIKHADNLYTRYAHLSSMAVSTGDSVSAGDVIGVCGTTGTSTNPHLHMEVQTTESQQSTVNPRSLLGI
ncbi:lysozyme family protein [Planococcus sp. S3-L1]|uniref:M23 family metallopeptidase n=1 Tax=Planococcus sp. S3-L1 TaxID=3046200 RepID=UPI0024B8A4F9|nr:lysozyme family protein [Planococcus sp. S3-L1]MDJ0333273.1 lysozyme family protein [Planococcus sp. S3-L1]